MPSPVRAVAAERPRRAGSADPRLLPASPSARPSAGAPCSPPSRCSARRWRPSSAGRGPNQCRADPGDAGLRPRRRAGRPLGGPPRRALAAGAGRLGAGGAAGAWSFADPPAGLLGDLAGDGAGAGGGALGPGHGGGGDHGAGPECSIAGITFITGFTGTIFVPLTAALIDGLGWRDALLALAALQVIPARSRSGCCRSRRARAAPPHAAASAWREAVRRRPSSAWPALRGACLHRHRPRRACDPPAAGDAAAGGLVLADRRAARAFQVAARRRCSGWGRASRCGGVGHWRRCDTLRHAGAGAGAAGVRLAGAVCLWPGRWRMG